MPLRTAIAAQLARCDVMVMIWCGRSRAAMRRLDQMLEHGWLPRFALATRAHLVAASGAGDAARADLEALLARWPEDAAAWFNLGYLLHEDHQDGPAQLAFERALAIDPGLDRAWYGLALVLAGQDELAGAERALRRNTELQPFSPFGWSELARVLARQGRGDEAMAVARHLQGFEPLAAASLIKELSRVPLPPGPAACEVPA